jgi:hypothetical protein
MRKLRGNQDKPMVISGLLETIFRMRNGTDIANYRGVAEETAESAILINERFLLRSTPPKTKSGQ